MKIHKEQDVDAKLFWYVVSALLIITYITAGLVIMFSSLLDDEFSKSARYIVGSIFLLFALYRGYTVWCYSKKINDK
ncbi:MAG: hypothetical protein RR555_03485 [Bacteroidales bacterium]